MMRDALERASALGAPSKRISPSTAPNASRLAELPPELFARHVLSHASEDGPDAPSPGLHPLGNTQTPEWTYVNKTWRSMFPEVLRAVPMYAKGCDGQPIDAKQLSTLLQQPRPDLNLQYCQIKDDMVVADKSADSTEVTRRDLGPIASYVANTMRLTSLDLSRNEIGPRGAKALAVAMSNHAGLKDLNLAHNVLCGPPDQPDYSGIEALAQALENSQLQTLNLGFNQIGEGTVHIARFLLVSTTLTKLNLEATFMTSNGLQEIAKSINNHVTLTTLLVARNGNTAIGENMNELRILFDALTSNTVLTSLDLSSYGFGSKGVEIIAKHIGPGLKVLNLRKNLIGTKGASALIQMLSDNRTGLKTLDLSWNGLGSYDNDLTDYPYVKYLNVPGFIQYDIFLDLIRYAHQANLKVLNLSMNKLSLTTKHLLMKHADTLQGFTLILE